MGIEDVRFTKDEYEDYFLHFCRKYLRKIEDENDIRYLQEYVHNTQLVILNLSRFS